MRIPVTIHCPAHIHASLQRQLEMWDTMLSCEVKLFESTAHEIAWEIHSNDPGVNPLAIAQAVSCCLSISIAFALAHAKQETLHSNGCLHR